MVRYAALRFEEDANIADRVYWYRAPFPVSEGDRVFAPVGAHDKIQRAVVERTFEGEADDAPYDVRFLKDVSAKCGAYRRQRAGKVVFEAGGVPYDGKHFTRFGRVLFCPDGEAADAVCALRGLLEGGERLLCGREGVRAAALLCLLAGAKEGDVRSRLALCGCEDAYPAEGCALLAMHFTEEELSRLAGLLR